MKREVGQIEASLTEEKTFSGKENFLETYRKEVTQYHKEQAKAESKTKGINRSFLPKAAAFLLVAGVAAGTLTMATEAFRETILEMFSVVQKQYTELTFRPEATGMEFPKEDVYYLTSLPEGYALMEEEQNERFSILIYQNTDRQALRLTQKKRNKSKIQMDTEGAEQEPVQVGGHEAVRAQKEGVQFLYWQDDAFLFVLHADDMGLDLVKIAENLQKRER